MFVDSCYVVVGGDMCVLPLFCFAVLELFIPFIFLGVVKRLGLGFSFSHILHGWIYSRYCLNMVLSWNILFSSFMVIESLLGMIVWAGIYGLLETLKHLSGLIWLLESHWKVRCCKHRLRFLFLTTQAWIITQNYINYNTVWPMAQVYS